MKKRIAVALLAAVLGVAAALPYGFGLQTEQAYNEFLDDLERRGDWRVSERRYHRGWLESQATSALQSRDRPLRVMLNHRVGHGPFPLDGFLERVKSVAPVSGIVASRARVSYGEGAQTVALAEPLEVQSVVDLRGNVSSRLRLAAATLDAAEGVRVSWEPLRASLTWNAASGAVVGRYGAPAVAIETAYARVSTGPLAADFRVGPADASTELSLDVEDIDVQPLQSGAAAIAARRLDFVSTTSEAQGELAFEIEARVDSLGIGAARYGSGTLVLRLDGLDARAVTAMRGSDGVGAAAAPALALMRAVTQGEPRLQAHLDLLTDAGRIEGSGDVTIDDSRAGTLNPIALLAAIRVQASASFPATIARAVLERRVRDGLSELRAEGKLPQMTPEQESEVVAAAVAERLRGLVQSNKLVAGTDDRYSVAASLQGGAFSLNGVPATLPFFD